MNYKITVIIVLFLSLIVWSNSGFAAGLTDGLVGYWPLDGNEGKFNYFCMINY